MFLRLFLFEIKYRLRHISTYVYFLIWFAMTFFSISANDFGPFGASRILRNGPYALTLYNLQFSAFGMIIISAIFGTSILRDFQRDTYQLIFTKPISKRAYLGGRLAGSFVIGVFIFSGIVFGSLLGPLAPWIDPTRAGPVNFWFIVQPFLLITVVQIFFLGCLFFLVAALTRQIMVVYLQGVVIFCVYLIGAIFVLNRRDLNTFIPAVFDPLGLVLSDHVTRYWTVVEKNRQLWQLSGAVLWNRLLWCGIGLVSLISTFLFFPMSAEQLTRKRTAKAASKRKDEPDELRPQLVPARMPKVHQRFGSAATWMQFRSLTRVRFLNVIREIPYWALCLVTLVLAFINGRQAGHVGENNVWPVTYLVLQMVSGNGVLWLAIATLYVGELVWRERDVKYEQIHDSLPVTTWVDSVSKFTAMAGAELLLFVLLALCGLLVQASLGYFHFELLHYCEEIFVIAFIQLFSFTLYAFFWQTVMGNKFVGHVLVVGTMLLTPVLYQYGFENRLYVPFDNTPYTYSDMNGYGHFVPGLFWSTFYWLAFAAMLAVVAIALARRGTDLGWKARMAEGWRRMPALSPAFALCFAAFLGSGVWFYYNAHVLNEFRTAKQTRNLRADYERHYKRYERLAQPKVVDVETDVDMYPERRSFAATGHYILENRSGAPIPDIHVSAPQESVDWISFDRPFHAVLQDHRLRYSIYHLESPLQPGDRIRMDFRASYTSHGFRDGGERAELAYNGMFFDRDYFPAIGYVQGLEVDDPVRRREEKLPPLEDMARPGDPYYRNVNLFAPNSGWISYKAVVSTSPDQIAIAPGYLQREWMQNGRHYFEYGMGSTRINDFYSFVSARYAVKRDRWHDVSIEIYYQPGHEYNLDRMIDATKKGLDYYTANFGPYQFKQFRILEFPRYRTFAQSFPNTVPYSEGIGFIQRMEKPDDLDMVFYVTAHELAHQWWGHQLIGSMTQGSNMMSETLAQYSALMVMEKEYGPYRMQRFLKHELDLYLRGRGSEQRKEPPLGLVQREPYVWYRKGSLVMYALRDYIGEAQLNAALRSFLEEYKYAPGPFPDTAEFEACLRQATPPDKQYVISDMFDKIILYDNKAVSATATPIGGGKYKVVVTVAAHKKQADGAGAETEVPLDDLVDIGVLSQDEGGWKPLYLEKKRLTTANEKFEVVVQGKPYKAGIDPYNKLIDRNPEDNLVPVTF